MSKKRFSKSDQTTYNYYKRKVAKLNGHIMSKKEWERYFSEEENKALSIGKDFNPIQTSQRIIGISAGLLDEDQYMGQMRARARQLYLEGKLNINPDRLSDTQLMQNIQVQNDRIELKTNYANLKAAYDKALLDGQTTFMYNDAVYLVSAGLGKAFSQAFFGSN